jgi:hypothetical protein
MLRQKADAWPCTPKLTLASAEYASMKYKLAPPSTLAS